MHVSAVKDDIRQLADSLPEDATYDDAMYAMYVKSKIARSDADIAAGKTVSHEEVVRRFEEWLR